MKLNLGTSYHHTGAESLISLESNETKLHVTREKFWQASKCLTTKYDENIAEPEFFQEKWLRMELMNAFTIVVN